MKAERFPANVLNVTLFGKQCDWHPYPTVQNWKDSCEKELDLGGFPWTQIFNAKFSGKKVYCSKAYSEQEPFCMLQLLARLAFFTSTLNPTAFLSWAERFPVRCIWGPKLPLQNIRYNQWVSPAWAGWFYVGSRDARHGEKPKWSLLLPSPGAALEACGSSWSPPHLGTAEPWGCPDEHVDVPIYFHYSLISSFPHTLCCFPDFCPQGT